MMERSLEEVLNKCPGLTAERLDILRRCYDSVTERIARAAERSGRAPEDVTLVAVTKTVGIEVINASILLGVTHIGENRVQELASKYDSLLGREKLAVSVIGHLQTNKARRAVEMADMIQSIDSLHVAEAVSRHAAEQGKTLPCLIEVNIGGEESKSGIEPGKVEELVFAAAELPSIEVQGLMIIPPVDENVENTRRYFEKIHNLFIDIESKKPHNSNVMMRYLSMGMSADFAEAVEEGSNMVRVGSALYGARIYREA